MKKYLITGGLGFIGSNLTEKILDLGNKVVVIDNCCDYYDPRIKNSNIESFKDNSNYELFIGDIRDKKFLDKVFSKYNFDCIIHLAAMAGVRNSIENPILYQEVNCIGTQNILDCMKSYNIKNIIMTSSSSVYGNCDTPFKEDMNLSNPVSPYAATKRFNEMMINIYHDIYNINAIVLRLFTVYGPRQRPDLAISKFTELILNNKEIPMYGDGSSLRDYTYIDDIISGIIKSIDYIESNSNVNEIINLGNSKQIELKKMINTLGKILNIKPKIKKLPMQPGDVIQTYADITKAKKMLGYEPKVTFEEGVKKFVEWYLNK